MTILLFILILGILVFVHEFGHFIAARKTGMRVHEFALGFPPLLLGVYKDPKTGKFVWVGPRKAKRSAIDAGASTDKADEYPATLYSLNVLPLGGFCKIKGENGEEAAAPDSFGYQKTWKKVIVLVAGVTMNFLLAAVILGIGFMIGLPTDLTGGIDDKYAIIEGQPRVLIQDVKEDAPAAAAGLKVGDEIVAFNGVSVTTTGAITSLIRAQGTTPVQIAIKRENETQNIEVAPIIEGDTAKIGVILADAGIVRYPWYIAIFKGISNAWYSLLAIFVGFYVLIRELILGNGLAFDIAGPVGIASIIGQSARLGMLYLINVTAMISLSLAAINILPIPALDGGRLLFVFIEKLTGKAVPMKYEQMAHTIGFVLLLLLIIVITFRDISGLI